MRPLLTALTIALALPLAAQATPKLTVTPLGNNIYMLSGKGGGNIGVMTGADGTLIIDDQLEKTVPVLLKTIKTLGGTTPPRYLLNTHYHRDHTGGNKALQNKNTTIISQINTRKRLAKDTDIKAFNVTNKALPDNALPNITFAREMQFNLDGHRLDVVYFPRAHTDGDTAVYFKDANILHTGDLFFNGMYPFIDVDNGGSIIGLIAAVQKLIATTDENTKIIPGHGPLANRADLIAFQDMLTFSNASVRDLKKQGKTLEQAIKADPLVDYDAKWGHGIFSTAKWLELLYTAP